MKNNKKESLGTKLKEFIKECKRVLRVTRKPEKDEFKNIVKVTGLGITVIGFMGFIIQIIKHLFS